MVPSERAPQKLSNFAMNGHVSMFRQSWVNRTIGLSYFLSYLLLLIFEKQKDASNNRPQLSKSTPQPKRTAFIRLHQYAPLDH
jgi:hypothetical protein